MPVSSFVSAFVAVLALLCAAMCFAVPSAPLAGVPWPATDALGRNLPLSSEVGPLRKDRWVGIFYFLWHDNPAGQNPRGDGPYDIGKILQADPDARSKPESPLWGPVGMYHYWGEPLYALDTTHPAALE